jgi:probable rRNA maturation factor
MVEINNLTKVSVDKRFLKKIGEEVLKKEKKDIKDLSVALIGQKEITELNKDYRKKDKPTDVLSFQYNILGEIVICPEVVRANAKKFNSTFKKELARVLIHGILHLLGYSHETNTAKAKKMRKKEEDYLLQLKL